MAKSPKEKDADDPTPSQPSLVVALLILTVIAGGAGSGFAFMFLNTKAPPAAAVPTPDPSKAEAGNHDKAHDQGHGKAADKGHDKAHSERFPADAVELALDPIITNIGTQAKSRLRLEASVMLSKTAKPQPSLKKELAEDIIAFLNGVSVEQVSGVRGFQNLREDLNDRARIRGRGAVLGLLISGFVLE